MECHIFPETFVFLIINQDLHDPSQVIHRDSVILRENQTSALTSCALSHHSPLPNNDFDTDISPQRLPRPGDRQGQAILYFPCRLWPVIITETLWQCEKSRK